MFSASFQMPIAAGEVNARAGWRAVSQARYLIRLTADRGSWGETPQMAIESVNIEPACHFDLRSLDHLRNGGKWIRRRLGFQVRQTSRVRTNIQEQKKKLEQRSVLILMSSQSHGSLLLRLADA